VLESLENTSLIEVRLHTGKRNQIRIQARLRGHTLVGEQRYVYGPADIRPIDFARQALHAHRLTFQHPADGSELSFEAPLPQDLVDLLRQLRSAAGSIGSKRSV
jgi:23S rRNA pseudouridine1911/1915/1917 synthase